MQRSNGLSVLQQQMESIIAIGCFGSYARGDQGVGSDLDLIVIFNPPKRLKHWDVAGLPVPAEVLSYTVEQWQQIPDHSVRFAQTLARESKWPHGSPPARP